MQCAITATTKTTTAAAMRYVDHNTVTKKKKKFIGSFSALFHENVQAVFSPQSPTFSPCESCCVGQCNVIITRDYGISTIIINEDMCVYATANSRSTHAIHMQRCKF